MDSTFRDPILPVGIDPTKGNSLLVFLNGVAEGVVGESTVVGMVVANSDSVGVGECLKGLLHFNCFI
jgi:hypothetical protein